MHKNHYTLLEASLYHQLHTILGQVLKPSRSLLPVQEIWMNWVIPMQEITETEEVQLNYMNTINSR